MDNAKCVDETESFHESIATELKRSASAYIDKDSQSIICEYIEGPDLFHNNISLCSRLFYMEIEYHEEFDVDEEEIHSKILENMLRVLDNEYALNYYVIFRQVKYEFFRYQYLFINPFQGYHTSRISGNGVVVPFDIKHPRTLIQDLYPFLAFETTSISVSSVSVKFAAKLWTDMVTGHGFQNFPVHRMEFGHSQNNKITRVTNSELHFEFLEKEWKKRRHDNGCKLTVKCTCDWCGSENHSFCKERGYYDCDFINEIEDDDNFDDSDEDSDDDDDPDFYEESDPPTEDEESVAPIRHESEGDSD
jgi:hypothetical protein